MTPDQQKKSETEEDKGKAETPARDAAKTSGYNPRTNEDYIPKAKSRAPDSVGIGRGRTFHEEDA